MREIIRRPSEIFARAADKGELLAPRDIVWIGAMEIAAGEFLLIQADERALRDGLL